MSPSVTRNIGMVATSFVLAGAAARADAPDRYPGARPASQIRTGGQPSRYAHGFDPYDGRIQSGGARDQGYSPRTYAFHEPFAPAGGFRTPDEETAGIYGYDGQDMDALSTRRGGQVFGYYYDPATGELRHGWHYRAPSWRDESRRPGPAGSFPEREQILGYHQPEAPPLRSVDAGRQGLAHFAGEVIELSTVTDRTSNRVHLLALIRQPDGSRQAVEMGPFARTGVVEGDWVEGLGAPGRVQERRVLLARHVSVNGLWQNIHDNAGREGSEYTGRIVSLRSVLLAGDLEPQAIADIRLPDRSMRPTLLGSTRDPASNLVRVGDRVVLVGVPATLNNRPAIVAHQLQLDGRRITVNYPRDQYAFETLE